jgi:phosphatidylglycerol lysyltransferase
MTASLTQARRLILHHGWNSTAYQILNPGIEHWFNASQTAVVGYTERHGFLLVAGAPVCAHEDLAKVLEEFEALARGRGCRVCYVCAEDRLASHFASSAGHATVAAGEQPVWDPREWAGIVSTCRSLRSQIRRAENKGVRVEPVDPRDAAADPEFGRVLKAWLRSRRLPTMHFLVEPEIFARGMQDRIVLAARSGGRTLAFLIASPVPARHGYFIEELARRPDAPNGAAELLIDAAMRRFAAEGCGYATMGLVALARNCFLNNPWWLRTLMLLARAHANRFYNFRGLERFRAKMQPARWDKVWFISNEERFSVRALYAVGAAFSGISPVRAVGIALLKAAAYEIRTVAHSMRMGIE